MGMVICSAAKSCFKYQISLKERHGLCPHAKPHEKDEKHCKKDILCFGVVSCIETNEPRQENSPGEWEEAIDYE